MTKHGSSARRRVGEFESVTVFRSLRFVGAALLAAAAAAAAVRASDLPVVFVSIPPQKYVVEQLAGELLRVEVMLPPGASPATYEPSPRQLAALERSVVFFRIGVPFEGPVLSKISKLSSDLDIVDCRDGIALEPIGEEDGHHHGPLDPHIWLDPNLMERVARTTAAALRARIPAAAAAIDSSLPGLLEKMAETDIRISSVLRPFAGREVLVFHPAFGYFTRRYGLIQIAVESSGKAPTARQLVEIVDSLRGQDAPAIFVQPQFSQASARRVADALGCRLIVLDPLAENYLTNLEDMAHRIAGAMEH